MNAVHKTVAMVALSLLPLSSPAARPTTFHLQAPRSFVRVHLGKTGLFAFAGDEHHIAVPVLRGEVVFDPDDPSSSSCDAEFATAQMKVDDPNLSDGDRAEVQRRMESSLVLDVPTFPRASFKSTSVRATGPDRLEVVGNLTLLGRARPVTLDVQVQSTSPRFQARATARFKQTLFGIEPISAAAGAVKVKDEVDVEIIVDAAPEP